MNLDKLRTILANERTFLAYIRTSMSAVIFGLAVLKFFPDDVMLVRIGGLALAAGLIVLVWGGRQYRQRNKIIKEVETR